jgi:alkanesulfonate monooxygenase SsuD/methylene tetrahydromethanopterin reductase-like flavin-dependent oxidoreductase (luciferase family)
VTVHEELVGERAVALALLDPLGHLGAGRDPLQLEDVLSCSAIGSPATVRQALHAFVERTGADELMITSQIFDHQARLRSYEIAAAAR